MRGCVYLLKTWTQKDVKQFIVTFFFSSITIKDQEEREMRKNIRCETVTDHINSNKFVCFLGFLLW